MKTASKNVKQQCTISNYFTKLPKQEPLKNSTNIHLNSPEKSGKTNTEIVKNTGGSSSKTGTTNSSLKRNGERDENDSVKKKRIISPVKTSPKRVKQKTIDDFNFDDVGDEFFKEMPAMDGGGCSNNLNLSKLERYKVENVEVMATNDIKLTVKNLIFHNTGICIVKSPWNACVIHAGDVVSIQGRWSECGDHSCWIVDWDGGLLVTNSDHLISSTTVVNSLYCPRKTVLSHIFKEQTVSIKSPTCMLVGCIVHELLQEVLTNKLTTLDEIEKLFVKKKDSKSFKVQLFMEDFKHEEIVEEITYFIPKIYDFVCKYVNHAVSKNREVRSLPRKEDDWPGEIIAVTDIEENIWSHKLGVKGKIDVTVRVNIRNRVKTLPLELKTGKVSRSNLEHRGQIILYCMMLKELGENIDSGLLLYLRDEGELIDVKLVEKERRDIILLRNGLSGWLRNIGLVKPSPNIAPPNLPRVINRTSCQSCPQLIACSSALRKSGEIDQLKESHIMKKLSSDSTSHLSDQHLQYIFHWVGLLSLEFESSKFSVSRIWSVEPKIREAKGWCSSNMKVSSSVYMENNQWAITFVKMNGTAIVCSMDPGQTVVISNDSHIAITMGSVKEVASTSVTVRLDKDMAHITPPIYIDCYESTSINSTLMSNLGLLLIDTPQAASLRESIIDLKLPNFAPKLSSKIKRVGEDIFKNLNKDQVRAILQAISAEKYILIKGMPGAGKTATMRALIELFIRLGKRIMVTSFTHSAIDNILVGLPALEAGHVLRLGPMRRINPIVARHAAEDNLLIELGDNVTSEILEEIYSQKRVVGVTCLGCNHPWLQRQRFDVCLVDEATQVSQPAILKPLSLADKFILIGDPKQLPPLVLNSQAKQYGLAVSLFEKLDRPAVTSRLTIQYRMNSFITQIVNELIYEGQLKCGTDQVAANTISYDDDPTMNWPDWLKVALDKSLDKSVIVIDVLNTTRSVETFDNKDEANVIEQITLNLQKVGINLKEIGVIATYRDQVNLLKSLLNPDIEVNTVDQYQGRDKEVVLFSTTKSAKVNACNDILRDTNRFTVAITRAKKKLIIIGNVDVLKEYTNFKRLFTILPCENCIKYVD